jgi:hypothetical protein
MKTATYGDLFDYLSGQGTRRNTDSFLNTRRFLREHGVPSTRVIEILEGFGGYDDQEVLWNAASKIPLDTTLSQDVETPAEFGIRHDLWVSNGNGFGEPDLNAAIEMMEANKHG